jgi:hypothetical protein
MNALTITAILWGISVAAYVALTMYRSYLSQHETDQLYLSEATPSAGHIENDEFIRKSISIEPLCRGVAGAAILMTLVTAGVWLTHMLSAAKII